MSTWVAVLVVIAVAMAIPTLALLTGLVRPGENRRIAYAASLLTLWMLPVAWILIARFGSD